jgi:hypothetical protein
MIIARHGFNPSIRDSNNRLRQVGIGKTNCLEHGPSARPVSPVGDGVTAVLWIKWHYSLQGNQPTK